MSGWLVLSPEQRPGVAAEWLARRARERPRPPVEDRPPVVVRGSEPVRRVQMAEASS